MGLETGTYISDLVATNPVGSTDQASTGDDHLRLIKSTIKATFANVSGAITATHTELNKLAAANLTGAAVDEIGYKGAPQNSQTGGNYTFILSDAGKSILGNGPNTYTIPSNASVAYPVGTIIIIANNSGTTALTIAINTDALELAGAGTTGSRTLSAYGLATLYKYTTTGWRISGAGVS